MSSYGPLADWYDSLTEDVDYEGLYAYLMAIFRRNGIQPDTVLDMACGTGSASMMTTSLAPLVAMFPDLKEELTALAASSNMLSGLDGLYMSVFIGLPMTEFLVRLCGVKDAPSKPGAQK